MQFYMAYSKELIRSGEGIVPEGSEIELLKRTLKSVRDDDIEIFLHYNPEVAVQIVEDLIEAPSKVIGNQINKDRFGSNNGRQLLPASISALNNAIDKETKSLAVRIKKCPHFKSYKQFYVMAGNSMAGKALIL